MIYYRTVAVVSFDSTATGGHVRDVLEEFQAEIIAGTPLGDYVIRFPDPGPDPERLLALVEGMNRMPRVSLAYTTVYYQEIIRGGFVGKALTETSR